MPDSALTGLSRSDEETKQNSRRDSGFLSVLPAVCVGSVLTRFGVLVIIQVDEAENMRYFAPGTGTAGRSCRFFLTDLEER